MPRYSLWSAETAQSHLAQTASRLADADGRLREHLEGGTELGCRAIGCLDPVLGDAHGAEDLPEVGVAVVDTHAGHDVHLAAEHVIDHGLDFVCPVAQGPLGIAAVGEDQRSGTGGYGCIAELLGLGQDRTEHNH